MKAERNGRNLRQRLRGLGHAMKNECGGYAMITVLVICGIVVGLLIWATLIIVQQSYTAQERQFARQVELLQAEGDTQAALVAFACPEMETEKSNVCANMERWRTESGLITWDDFADKLPWTEINPVLDANGILIQSQTFHGKVQGYYRYPVITDGTDPVSGKPTKTFTWILLYGENGTSGEKKTWVCVTTDITLVLTLDADEKITALDVAFGEMNPSVFTQHFA